MEGPGLRLHQIRIEGFKGFTIPQTIDLEGKHLFVLGPNGYGKSSIIEAIRWGLFGSALRPGEVVANQSYSGSCRIEAKLVSSGTPLVLKRALIRGASGGSDASVSDKTGRERSIREVLPQLESVPAGEGMHVVYSAQTAPQRRSVENLDAFERTLFTYLDLSDVPLMLGHLGEFIETHQAAEARLGQEIGDEKRRLEDVLAGLNDEVARILLNPPWGQQTVPTESDTAKRIGAFARQLLALLPDLKSTSISQDVGGSLSDAERLLGQLTIKKSTEFESAKNAVVLMIQAANQLSLRVAGATATRGEVETQITIARNDRTQALAGDPIEALTSKLEAFQRAATESALVHELRTKGLEWVESIPPAGKEVTCPVCSQTSPREGFSRHLEQEVARASTSDKARLAELEALKRRQTIVSHADARLRELTVQLSDSDAELERLKVEVQTLVGAGQTLSTFPRALQGHLESERATLAMVERQGETTVAANSERQRRLDLLKDEVRYHRAQDQARDVRGKIQQVGKAETSLRELSLFGDSTRRIKEALTASLVEQLKASTPFLNERLTAAFNSLTSHPSYDMVVIHIPSLPSLKIRVASSADPENLQHPGQVLNGQAVNALELVPYFAFAELTEAPIEVLLLMLDDPTQSFDTSHIEILVAKLADLGKRVQLVIATHEVEKFDEFVGKSFQPGEYSVVRVKSFDKRTGPGLIHAPA
jgi:DNA repair exonuclease SbcCD ATPase subunit